MIKLKKKKKKKKKTKKKKKKKKEIKNSKSRGDPQKTTAAKQIKKIFVNGKNLGINKNEKKNCCCSQKFNWGNALINSLGKGPFIDNKKC